MSILGSLAYHANVSVAGAAVLRWQRLRLERRMRRPGSWKHETLGPPPLTSPRLKELISTHYLRGRFADRRGPVAWVTSGAPVEFLVALGYYVTYPENHGAVCGIRRAAEDLCTEAESAGWSRDVCSYARTDIGAALSGRTPVGRLPRPTVLVCCTNICQTVLYWYRVLAHHFGCPLLLIDTPFVYEQATEHALAYVRGQVERAIEGAERAAGRSLDMRRLVEVTRLSKDAALLWQRVMDTGRSHPAPITAFDEFIHMAPIVEMRGHAGTVSYYAALLAELEQRIARGEGALLRERHRVLWDNLPIWHRVRWLSELLAERGIALVASTYTNAWGELAPLIDPERPIESAARVHIHAILNRGTGDKLATMTRMAKDYGADGVIMHSDRSCKPYSMGQIDQRERLGTVAGLPALLLEADHNDPRTFSEEQVRSRVLAFAELLGG